MATAPQINDNLNSAVTDVAQASLKLAADIFAAYRETGTITANGTVGFIERVPGEHKIISINLPHPFDRNKPLDY